MKKRFLPLPAALLLLVLAAGCNNVKVATYLDEIALPLAEGRTDSLLVDIQLEYAAKTRPAEAADAMNRAILSAAFDLEVDPGSVEETALRYREELIDAYLTENGNRTAGVLSWEDRLQGIFQSKYGPYLTYVIDYYSYRGGAHGVETLTPIVFDRETGRTLSEADLFAEGTADAVSALVRAALAESMSERAEEDVEVEDGLPVLNGTFGVDEDGVTWYYQPYEIAPFAMGILTATVSWDDLKPYLGK